MGSCVVLLPGVRARPAPGTQGALWLFTNPRRPHAKGGPPARMASVDWHRDGRSMGWRR
jgi:hypothetical protein